MSARRSVVTGIGVVAPGGGNREEFWQRITSGKPAIRRISTFDPEPFRSQIAAECDFEPSAYRLTPQEIRRLDRFVLMAMACADEAYADSGLDGVNPERMGVSLGSAVGSTIRLEEEYVVASDGGRHWVTDPTHVRPFLYQALVPSSAATEPAVRFHAQGPAAVVSTGCTSGIDAIGHAHTLIQEGEADVVIVVGADAASGIVVLKADRATGLRPAQFGDSDKVGVGTRVLAIGSPSSLGGSVTAGLVSALHRNSSPKAGTRAPSRPSRYRSTPPSTRAAPAAPWWTRRGR
ncbi:trypsin-like peptidase [Nonomuraea polychroma]|uniref:Trypsin-like peptidase n=1 Tax=Nonomuraea polychroma TaxID=46176 RepID=A0A438MAF4_9ACTN|nr:beta-ketoacyl synthase N-terminal-like domain-containing protein [Nonomuraea polychroma]RVX42668.1 trypsin-like peptidase [Nonomuraea polychroma]